MASLGLVMIACDVQKTIGRALSSARAFVDEIIVVDTGSEDRTREEAEKQGARVLEYNYRTHPQSFVDDIPENWKDLNLPGPYTGKKRLCDFASARQFGWNQAKSDYILWIDSDDVIENGARLAEILADMSGSNVDVAMLNYDYSQDDRGNVTLRLQRERIVKRGLFHWEQPVHEALSPAGVRKSYGNVNVVHLRDRDRHEPLWHHRNLKILYWHLAKVGMNLEAVEPRILFYLGLEQQWLQPKKAIESFDAYLKRSGWDEERAIALNTAGRILEREARFSEAMYRYAMASIEFPANPDGLLGAARCAYYLAGGNNSLWFKVVEWTSRAFETIQNTKQSLLMEDAHERSWSPHVFMSVALFNTNQIEKCIEVCEQGLKANPTEPHLMGNLQRARQILREREDKAREELPLSLISNALSPLGMPRKILESFSLQIWNACKETGSEQDLLRSFVLRDSERARKIFRKKARAKDGSLKIGIWTGPAWETWSPNSIDIGGIGGSETAAIHMANELAERGHDVTVFGVCSGLYGKVRYVEHGKQRSFEGDIFIVSRQAHVLLEKWWKADRCYLWVHDIHAGTDSLSHEAVSRADAVFALSKWHANFLKQTYPGLRDKKIFITRNGIDTSRFYSLESPEKLKQDRPRLIYASSPDRGLSYLLDLLPSIRKEIPAVELHLYYGFNNWISMTRSPEMAQQKMALEELQRKISISFGVYQHGRVGQRELAGAFLRSRVWAYPTWFTETSCITAMEAQAAGCVPVTSDLAALSETVVDGLLIKDEICTPSYGKAFVEGVVDLLTNKDGMRTRLSSRARERALKELGWNKVASEWEVFFNSSTDKKKEAQPMNTADLGQLFSAISEGNVSGIKPKARTTIADPEKPPLRFALMYGLFSSGIHGKFDIPSLWEKSGLTGSESCFFNMAKALSESGHQVDVFCDTVAHYQAHSELAGSHVYPIRSSWPDDSYDIYMAWNEPDLLRSVPANKLRVCFQQLNDFASYSEPGFDECVDLYVMPSHALKNHLVGAEKITASKISVLPNSINLDFYEREYQRGKTIVWCSSPDRGLHVLLPIFEEVRRHISDVTLKVFYRYDQWVEDNLRYPGSEGHSRAMEIEAHLARVGRSGENGVIMFDSVSNRRMARELLSAKAFAYTCEPLRFTEGFSVSIMDACAAGCVPVISDADALPEIYGEAAHIVKGTPSQRKQEWVETLCRVFADDEFARTVSTRARAFSSNFGRKEIAGRLVDLVRETREKRR